MKDAVDENFNSRQYYLDILRIIACFMVIMIHIISMDFNNYLPATNEWKVMNSYDSIIRYSVPLFYMISGALFLGSNSSISIKKLYLNKIFHLLILYIVWSIFYAVDDIGVNITINNIKLLIEKSWYHKYYMWFIPSIITIYILAPVLYTIVHNDEKIFKYIITVFILFGIIKSSIIIIPFLNHDVIDFINRFNVDLCQGCGYFMLGYYLSKVNLRNVNLRGLLILLIVLFGTSIKVNELYAVFYNESSGLLYGYYNCFTCAEGIIVFLLIRKALQNIKLNNIWVVLSKCSLGIYLIHPFIIEHLYFNFGFNINFCNPAISILILTLLVFLVSFILIFILHKIPILNKILV